MKNDLSIIYEMLEQLDQIEDQRFLKHLYTLINRHLEKKGKH